MTTTITAAQTMDIIDLTVFDAADDADFEVLDAPEEEGEMDSELVELPREADLPFWNPRAQERGLV